METLTTDTVHTAESICPTLSCIDVQDIDEVSKEKEEELLYGAEEDDALSDDSLRLRVSDDEDTETGDASVPVKTTDEDEKPKNVASESIQQSSEQPLESEEISSDSKEKPSQKTVCASEKAEEADLESGNVLTRERIMSEPMRNRQMRGGGVYGSPVGGQFLISRMKGHDNRRRFPSVPHPQPYHPEIRPSYVQQRYVSQNNHYRTRSEHYWNDPTYYSGFGGPSSYKYGRYSGNGHEAWSNCYQKRGRGYEKKPNIKLSGGQNESHADQPPSSGSVTAAEKEIKQEIVVKQEPSAEAAEPLNNVESNHSEQTNEKGGDIETDKVNVDTKNDISDHESPRVLHNEHNSEEDCTDKSNNESSCFKVSSNPLGESSEKSSEKDSCTDGTNEELPISNDEKIDKDVTEHPTELVDNCNNENDVNEKVVESRVGTLEENVVECNSVQNDPKINKDDESCAANVENKAQDVEMSNTNVDIKTENCSIKQADKREEDVEQTENKEADKCEMEVETDDLTKQEPVESTKDLEQVSETKEKENAPACNDETASPKPELTNKEEEKMSGCLEKHLTSEISSSIKPVQKSGSEKTTKSDEESSLSDENEKAGVQQKQQQQQTNKLEKLLVGPSKKKNGGEAKVVNIDSDTTDNPTSTDDSSTANRRKSLPATITAEAILSDNENKNSDELVVTQRRKRRSRRITIAAQAAALRDDLQGNGRQKRRTAKNAAEIIRKRFLNHDSDLESSDNSEKFVKVTPRNQMKENARSLSPPSLKRPCTENDNTIMNGNVKKPKTDSSVVPATEMATLYNNAEKIKNLNYARKFFQRDYKERLQKLKQEEFEELLIQMIAEVITNRSEMGKLREQARVSVRNQEALRTRCQQLAKQIKDLEMVLNRNATDRQANNNKPTAPIKINRSVGLQVNIVSTEYGIQNLRQIQNNTGSKTTNVGNDLNITACDSSNNATNPRRGLKVRSPRRSELSITPQNTVVPQSSVQNSSLISNVTPAALVVTKAPETQHNISLPTQPNNLQKVLQSPQKQQQPQQQQQQAVVLNGKIPTQHSRQSAPATLTKANTSDLIDLTDEEEKSKCTVPTTKVTTSSADNSIPLLPKPQAHVKPQQQQSQQPPQPQACFQRVIQAIPATVAISSQPNIRVVQPTAQPTPTALVNNMNAPRLAYVMQSSGPTRQLLITSNSNQIRPVTSCRPPFTTVAYKTGIQTIANGTVRVLTTPASPNVQLNKHPAPLPDTPNYTMNAGWKLPPPAPSLKISKHASGTQKGIVLSWDMALSDKHAEIVSYQLYAYQEIAGVVPSTALWKKVGDVRALPLPMACTLTQFSEGNNYYFAVRAVDSHSRKGKYSVPGNISL